MSYQIKWLTRGAYKSFSGHITAGEFFSGIAAIQNHPDYNSFKFSINNFLEVADYEITREDVVNYVALGLGAKVSNPNLVVAIVATDAGILRLIREEYEPMAKYVIGYFVTDEDAVQWIKQVTQLTVVL
jgi:hypothetical protein